MWEVNAIASGMYLKLISQCVSEHVLCMSTSASVNKVSVTPVGLFTILFQPLIGEAGAT
jgi:hypothetical protein